MCQEKVENKIKFSGSCMDVNTGAEVILEDTVKGTTYCWKLNVYRIS